jgi:SAM-dependent methyltransferase
MFFARPRLYSINMPAEINTHRITREHTMQQAKEPHYYKRDFWGTENLKYATPHFRLEKSAHLVNELAQGRACDLLDVGCGPATLMNLLDKTINYYGIDMAIRNSAPNLLQADFLETPIAFENKRFDIVVAQGVFEYAGTHQAEKFAEIQNLLTQKGTFLVSYVNFDHLNIHHYEIYNNMQSFEAFKRSLAPFFDILRIIPTSHNWHHKEPDKRIMKAFQMHFNINIPLISPLFAVEYFMICSPRASRRNGIGS